MSLKKISWDIPSATLSLKLVSFVFRSNFVLYEIDKILVESVME